MKQKAVEKEFEMALQDRVMEETKDKKNVVEAYVYDMRKKYQEFVTGPEKEELIAKLQVVEDWLYEDGEDEKKGVYIAKLDQLKKVIPLRIVTKSTLIVGLLLNNFITASPVIGMRQCRMTLNLIILSWLRSRRSSMSVDSKAWLRVKKQQQDSLPKYATPMLLSSDVKRKVEALDRSSMSVDSEAWLRVKKQQQDSLPKYATPVLLSSDVKRKVEALDRYFVRWCRFSVLYEETLENKGLW